MNDNEYFEYYLVADKLLCLTSTVFSEIDAAVAFIKQHRDGCTRDEMQALQRLADAARDLFESTDRKE